MLYMNQPNTPTRYATCSACAQQVICTQQDSYPDNGWVLPFDTFGYYGGFDDNLNVLSGLVRSREWICVMTALLSFLLHSLCSLRRLVTTVIRTVTSSLAVHTLGRALNSLDRTFMAFTLVQHGLTERGTMTLHITPMIGLR
jgi:hypothetical protein